MNLIAKRSDEARNVPSLKIKRNDSEEDLAKMIKELQEIVSYSAPPLGRELGSVKCEM